MLLFRTRLQAALGVLFRGHRTIFNQRLRGGRSRGSHPPSLSGAHGVPPLLRIVLAGCIAGAFDPERRNHLDMVG